MKKLISEHQQKQYDHRREMRAKAKAGDPEAMVIVARWYELTKAATKRAQEEGRSYDATYDRKKQVKFLEDKRKAAAGDLVAQAAVDRHRAQERKWATAKRRSKGVRPIAEAILAQKAAAQPVEVKLAKAKAYQKEWQRKMRERAKAGDPEAVAWHQKTLVANRAAFKKWRQKKNAAKVANAS